LPFAAALRSPLLEPAGRCDAVFDMPHPARRDRARYFFFRAVVFFAVFLVAGFFAADFVFDFVAFFAILPS
jgi:hypothetical protein